MDGRVTARPDFTALSKGFRITSFIDVLGWGSLTQGVPLLTFRRMARPESLTLREVTHAKRLAASIDTAHRINRTIQEILTELHGLCVPIDDIAGASSAASFFRKRHVVFVRASDCIFTTSSSYPMTTVFVSEMLKRGLSRGVLLRAGISAGFVHHVEDPVVGADPRARDISIFGDGITTAVEAEKLRKGSGVRSWCHSRLPHMLSDPRWRAASLRHARGQPWEIKWWHDFRTVWNGEPAEHVTPVTDEWLADTAARLRRAPEFAWNRRTPKGRITVDDTVALLDSLRSSNISTAKKR
jgi:hypothetical protein